MLKVCNQCHSINFAKGELEKGDEMIRMADRLMAQAIKIVADLYKEKILVKPKNYAYAFPDLLAFHDAPTVIFNNDYPKPKYSRRKFLKNTETIHNLNLLKD